MPDILKLTYASLRVPVSATVIIWKCHYSYFIENYSLSLGLTFEDVDRGDVNRLCSIQMSIITKKIV